MRPSSTTRPVANQPDPATSRPPESIREYRRPRQHLYPLEGYRAALATGGTIWSFCGILETVSCDNPTTIDEADAPSSEDCVTCVDLWRGGRSVRL